MLNPHGIEVCLPFKLAKEFVETKHGWKYIPPKEIPRNKRYPISRDMTETGKSRRRSASIDESEEAPAPATPVQEEEKDPTQAVHELESYSRDELRLMAKDKGVKRYWVMSKPRLVNELLAK